MTRAGAVPEGAYYSRPPSKAKKATVRQIRRAVAFGPPVRGSNLLNFEGIPRFLGNPERSPFLTGVKFRWLLGFGLDWIPGAFDIM